MFLIRAFPNISDDFLTAYRFAEVLAKRWRVGACFTSSDLMFPAIHEDDLGVFSSNLPLDSISLWFGPPQNYSLGNYKNYAFLTTVREDSKPIIVHQMNKFWELGDNFPYPFYPEKPLEQNGIFCYAPPMHNRMLETTIKAWALSDIDEPLKVLSPTQSISTLRVMIQRIKNDTGCCKAVYISAPSSTCPDDIKKEILKSRAVVDLRRTKSLSFANIVAQSSGIPTLGTTCTFPAANISINNASCSICKDGSRLSGEIVYEYDIEDIVDGFEKILGVIGSNKDSTKDILSISKEMIIGE